MSRVLDQLSPKNCRSRCPFMSSIPDFSSMHLGRVYSGTEFQLTNGAPLHGTTFVQETFRDLHQSLEGCFVSNLRLSKWLYQSFLACCQQRKSLGKRTSVSHPMLRLNHWAVLQLLRSAIQYGRKRLSLNVTKTKKNDGKRYSWRAFQ